MSKTFKSAVTRTGSRNLLVSTDIGMDAGFFLEVQDRHEGTHAICFENRTAPALALAVLEAAGVEPDREPLECQVSLGTIVADLQGTIRYAEALASANREQAELEAEALELFNICAEAQGHSTSDSWETVRPIERKDAWLAVARKAREIGAKK
ncbi:hypothetical protein AQ436_00250 [Arthrobacter sp. EpRS66]|nr:hypothetical protein AQ436_00250 [Arthrobacter sp. EpRS66]